MAKQCGNIKFTGTIDNLCFYRMRGGYYVRMKSSLTGKRVKTSPKFRLTMIYAGLMGRASKIGSAIYRSLPGEFRQFWMYRAFTGEAMQWLKMGKTDEEVKEILWKTYAEVWEHKENKMERQPASAEATVKAVIQIQDKSVTGTRTNTCAAKINNLFFIPTQMSNGKTKPVTGRRVLRRERSIAVLAL